MTHKEFSSKGGKKSRRVLTPEQAKAMVAKREENRKAKQNNPSAKA